MNSENCAHPHNLSISAINSENRAHAKNLSTAENGKEQVEWTAGLKNCEFGKAVLLKVYITAYLHRCWQRSVVN